MSITERITRALETHQRGDISGALNSYLEIMPELQDGPVLAKLHSNTGAVYMQQGNYEKAKDHFRLAADMNPEDASALMNLAIVLTSKLEDHKTALRYALRAVRANSSSPKGYHLLGNILQNMGRVEEAEQYFVLAESLAVEKSEGVETSDHLLLPDLATTRVSDEMSVEVDGRQFSMTCLSRHPLLFIARELFSEDECDQVMTRAESKLERSLVMGGVVNVEGEVPNSASYSKGSYRDSFNAWLAADPLLEELQKRIAALTRIPSAYVKLKAEELQVVKYNASGYFNMHHDSSMFHPRLLTALVYLNSLSEEDGGETWFPFANDGNKSFKNVEEAISSSSNLDPHSSGICIRPRKGDAIIFFNHAVDSSEIDTLAVHAGLKVRGEKEKWIANYWVESDFNLLRKLFSYS